MEKEDSYLSQEYLSLNERSTLIRFRYFKAAIDHLRNEDTSSRVWRFGGTHKA